MFYAFVSCNNNKDSIYFNGDIQYIEDVSDVTNVTLKAVPLYGTNYGFIAVYDTLMIFRNTKLPDRFFNIFNTETGEEIGEFCNRGSGPGEMFSVSGICCFFKEKNDLKTLLFAANEGKLFIWNISQSVKRGKTVIDATVSYKSRNEYGDVAYNVIYRQSEDMLLAHVQTTPLNSLESTLPFYQKRTFYSDSLLQTYDIYKKSVRNTKANVNSGFFFSSNDAFKPDGSKIVQAMGNLAQINIIDTHTGQVTGYRIKDTPDFSFFETTMSSGKSYYMRIQADNNYIYAPYWGKEKWGMREVPYINTIHVFDWNGKIIHKLVTDHPVHEIWLDQVRNRLYTTNVSTDEVFYLDLNELDFLTCLDL
jgi:hypothetical protein